MIVEFFEVIAALRRTAEPTQSSNPNELTYRQVARHFISQATIELNDPSRYFEVQFTPVRPPHLSLAQIRGELFAHLKQELSRPSSAFSAGRLSFAVPEGSKLGGEAAIWGSNPEWDYGLGTFGDADQARILLTPPGFERHFSGILTPIPVEAVGRDLQRDPFPNRHFRWEEDAGHWEAVAA